MTQNASMTLTRRPNSRAKPAGKISISDEIVNQIMSLISNGDLKAGQRLPAERELCIRFGASRSSVREALRCLCIVGVLSARVGEGTSVAADGVKFFGTIVEWRVMTEKRDIEDMMQLRLALEGLTAAKAALHHTEHDLAKLQGLLDAMKGTIDDVRRFSSLDLDFHLTLAKICDSSLIVDLLAMIRGQLGKTVSTVLLLPDALPQSLKEHTAIFRAIKRCNAKEASSAMEAHLSGAIKRYHKALESQGTESFRSPPLKRTLC